VEIREVGAHFGRPEAPVFESVSFSLAPGEIVALLGVSGSGKTTLLDILAGFRQADRGAVRLEGRVSTAPGAPKAMVFQEDALFPWLTAWENVAFGLRAAGVSLRERRKTAVRMLERVGLGDCGDRLPRELSGGMRQRVALARVLVLKPRLLLMDEPFAALDALTREDMHDLLLELHAEYRPAVLLVTHDVTEAAKLADRVMVLGRGRGILAEFEVAAPRPRDLHSGAMVAVQERCRRMLRS
jgi:NitT/TauT family transport system ATP-binding protein